MNELTQRLTVSQPAVMGGADPTADELRNRTGEMGYVLIKFTETRGGTELGFPVDREATDLSATRGKILFQTEGAETFYRNLELAPLK